MKFSRALASMEPSNDLGSGILHHTRFLNGFMLTGNDDDACAKFRQYPNRCFHIKDLGPVKCFLRIEVARNSKGLFLCQRKYTLEVVDECGL